MKLDLPCRGGMAEAVSDRPPLPLPLRNAEIVAKYEAGARTRALAQEYSVSPKRILQIVGRARVLGLVTRKQRRDAGQSHNYPQTPAMSAGDSPTSHLPIMRDNGCPDLGIPACLECPLPTCRYDERLPQGTPLQVRAQALRLLELDVAATVVAQMIGVSQRTVRRWRTAK